MNTLRRRRRRRINRLESTWTTTSATSLRHRRYVDAVEIFFKKNPRRIEFLMLMHVFLNAWCRMETSNVCRKNTSNWPVEDRNPVEGFKNKMKGLKTKNVLLKYDQLFKTLFKKHFKYRSLEILTLMNCFSKCERSHFAASKSCMLMHVA